MTTLDDTLRNRIESIREQEGASLRPELRQRIESLRPAKTTTSNLPANQPAALPIQLKAGEAPLPPTNTRGLISIETAPGVTREYTPQEFLDIRRRNLAEPSRGISDLNVEGQQTGVVGSFLGGAARIGPEVMSAASSLGSAAFGTVRDLALKGLTGTGLIDESTAEAITKEHQESERAGRSRLAVSAREMGTAPNAGMAAKAAEFAGGVLPYVVAPGAGTAAGAAGIGVGAGAAGFGSGYADVRTALEDQGVDPAEADEKAKVAGAIVAPVEGVLNAFLATKMAHDLLNTPALKSFIRKSVVNAVMGAGMGAGSSTARQLAGEAVGSQQEFSPEAVLEAAGSGALGFAALGGVLHGIEALGRPTREPFIPKLPPGTNVEVNSRSYTEPPDPIVAAADKASGLADVMEARAAEAEARVKERKPPEEPPAAAAAPQEPPPQGPSPLQEVLERPAGEAPPAEAAPAPAKRAAPKNVQDMVLEDLGIKPQDFEKRVAEEQAKPLMDRDPLTLTADEQELVRKAKEFEQSAGYTDEEARKARELFSTGEMTPEEFAKKQAASPAARREFGLEVPRAGETGGGVAAERPAEGVQRGQAGQLRVREHDESGVAERQGGPGPGEAQAEEAEVKAAGGPGPYVTSLRAKADDLIKRAEGLERKSSQRFDTAPGAFITGGSGRKRSGLHKKTERAIEGSLNDLNEAKRLREIAGKLRARADRQDPEMIRKEAARKAAMEAARQASHAKESAERKAAPIINEDTPGILRMTSDEWSKIPKDYKGLTVDEGVRVRTTIKGGALVPVFITDMPVKSRPPKEPTRGVLDQGNVPGRVPAEETGTKPPKRETAGGAGETAKPSGETTTPFGEPHPETGRKFSSTQFDLPEDVAKEVKAAAAKIPDADLAEDGREERPHITVKFGLHTDDAAKVEEALRGEKPVTVTLGETSLFKGEKHDVVKIDVAGYGLRKLNKKIAGAIKHTDTHKTYQPHVTLAYVKPGKGEKYAGDKSLAGRKITIDRIVFSGRDGGETVVHLGEPAAAETEMPTYREWRTIRRASNSVRIVPNRPGDKFTPEQVDQIAAWAKKRGLTVVSPSATGLVVIGEAGTPLHIDKYGAPGVKSEQAEVRRTEQKQEAEGRYQARKAEADNRESADWIVQTFGEGTINPYNRVKLSDFLEGTSEKFEGLASPSWKEGVEKVGALTADGKDIDWAKLRAAYEASKKQTPEPARAEPPARPKEPPHGVRVQEGQGQEEGRQEGVLKPPTESLSPPPSGAEPSAPAVATPEPVVKYGTLEGNPRIAAEMQKGATIEEARAKMRELEQAYRGERRYQLTTGRGGRYIIAELAGPAKGAGAEPMAAAQEARREATLSQDIRTATGEVMERRELVDKELSEGGKPEIVQVPDTAALNKAIERKKVMDRGWVPTGNEKHPATIEYRALQETIKNPPTRPEYRMQKTDDSWRVLTKAEYDHAISQKTGKSEPPYVPKGVEPPETAEPPKSVGHIAFAGPFEYIRLKGDVYRANVRDDIGMNGIRPARFESTASAWEESGYRTIERVRAHVARPRVSEVPDGPRVERALGPAAPERPGEHRHPQDPDALPRAGDVVDGRTVGRNIPNQGSISASVDDPRILPGVREVPIDAFEDSGPPTFYSVSEEQRTKALADKINASGHIDPLIVVYEDGNPYVLEGGHRFDALKLLGAKSFPALVVVEQTPTSRAPTATTGPATVASVDDISAATASQAFEGTSFSPEKRADSWRQDYVNTFTSVAEPLRALAKTPEQKAALESELARFRDNLRDRFVAFLQAHARVMSPMITGPARFPVEANAKKGDTAHRRLTEIIELKKKAEASIRRRLFPETSGSIRSDDANAVESLKAKIAEAQRLQDAMVEANKIVRGSGTDEEKVAAISALGLTGARQALKPDYANRTGYPSYVLQNNSANIRRMEQRVSELERMQAAAPREATFPGGRVIENKDVMRVQILYNTKPDEATRTRLKQTGFRWSPSEGAWQRLSNEAGWRAAVDATGAVEVPPANIETIDQAAIESEAADVLRREMPEEATPQAGEAAAPTPDVNVPNRLLGTDEAGKPITASQLRLVNRESGAPDATPAKIPEVYQRDIDKLWPSVVKQVAREVGINNKGSAALGVIRDEAPAIQTELMRRLWEHSPDAAGWIMSSGPVGLKKIASDTQPVRVEDVVRAGGDVPLNNLLAEKMRLEKEAKSAFYRSTSSDPERKAKNQQEEEKLLNRADAMAAKVAAEVEKEVGPYPSDLPQRPRTTPEPGTKERDAINAAFKQADARMEELWAEDRELSRQIEQKGRGTKVRAALEAKREKLEATIREAKAVWTAARDKWYVAGQEDALHGKDPWRRLGVIAQQDSGKWGSVSNYLTRVSDHIVEQIAPDLPPEQRAEVSRKATVNFMESPLSDSLTHRIDTALYVFKKQRLQEAAKATIDAAAALEPSEKSRARTEIENRDDAAEIQKVVDEYVKKSDTRAAAQQQQERLRAEREVKEREANTDALVNPSLMKTPTAKQALGEIGSGPGSAVQSNGRIAVFMDAVLPKVREQIEKIPVVQMTLPRSGREITGDMIRDMATQAASKADRPATILGALSHEGQPVVLVTHGNGEVEGYNGKFFSFIQSLAPNGEWRSGGKDQALVLFAHPGKPVGLVMPLHGSHTPSVDRVRAMERAKQQWKGPAAPAPPTHRPEKPGSTPKINTAAFPTLAELGLDSKLADLERARDMAAAAWSLAVDHLYEVEKTIPENQAFRDAVHKKAQQLSGREDPASYFYGAAQRKVIDADPKYKKALAEKDAADAARNKAQKEYDAARGKLSSQWTPEIEDKYRKALEGKPWWALEAEAAKLEKGNKDDPRVKVLRHLSAPIKERDTTGEILPPGFKPTSKVMPPNWKPEYEAPRSGKQQSVDVGGDIFGASALSMELRNLKRGPATWAIRLSTDVPGGKASEHVMTSLMGDRIGKPIEALKRIAKHVPEFRADPVLTVSKDGKTLDWSSGSLNYKIVNPWHSEVLTTDAKGKTTATGEIKAEPMKPGDTVRIDLDQIAKIPNHGWFAEPVKDTVVAAETPTGQKAISFLSKLDALAEKAVARMEKRAKERGVRLSANPLPDPRDARDTILWVGAKALSKGIKGGRELTALIREAIKTVNPNLERFEGRIRAGVRRLLDHVGTGTEEQRLARFDELAQELINKPVYKGKVGKELAQAQAGAVRLAGQVEAEQARGERTAAAAETAGFKKGMEAGKEIGRSKTTIEAADEIEKAVRKAYKGGVRDARREGRREAMEGLEAFKGQIARERQVAGIEARGAAEERRYDAATEEKLRRTLAEYVDKGVNAADQPKFLRAIARTRTEGQFLRQTERIQRVVARGQARAAASYAGQSVRWNKVMRYLLPHERAQMQQLNQDAAAIWSRFRKKGRPTTDMIVDAADMGEIADRMKEIRVNRKAMTNAIGASIRDERDTLAARTVKSVQTATPLANPVTNRPGVPLDPSEKMASRVARGWSDTQTNLDLLQGQDKTLTRVGYDNIVRSEDKRFDQIRDDATRLDQAAKAAGFKDINDLAARMTTELGEGRTQRVPVKLAGQTYNLTLGELFDLAGHAKRQATVGLIDKGVPWKFESQKSGDPIVPTAAEFQRAAEQFEEIAPGFLDAAHALMNERFGPAAMEKYKLTGTYPKIEGEGYWPRKRAVEERDNAGLPEIARGGGVNILRRFMENAGFYKDTMPDKKNPLQIRNGFNVLVEHLDALASATHMAKTARMAYGVLEHPDVAREVRRKHGNRVYRVVGEQVAGATGLADAFGAEGLSAKALRFLNRNLSVAALAFNPRSMAVNYAGGLARASALVGPETLKGVVPHPEITPDWIAANSSYFWRRWHHGGFGRFSPVVDTGGVTNIGSEATFADAINTIKENAKKLDWRGVLAGVRELQDYVFKAYNATDAQIARNLVTAILPEHGGDRIAALRRAESIFRQSQNPSSSADMSYNYMKSRGNVGAMWYLFQSDRIKAWTRLRRAANQGKEPFLRALAAEALNIGLSTGIRRAVTVAAPIAGALLFGDWDTDERQAQIDKAMDPASFGWQVANSILGTAAPSPFAGQAFDVATGIRKGQANLTGSPVVDTLNSAMDAVTTLVSALKEEDEDKAWEKGYKGILAIMDAALKLSGDPSRGLWQNVKGIMPQGSE